jgi:hypothetical protein
VLSSVEPVVFFPGAEEQVLPGVVCFDTNMMYCFCGLEHPLEPGLKHHSMFVIPSAIKTLWMLWSPNKYVPIFG